MLLAVLSAVGYSVFAHRYVIEAKVWHWKHGYTTALGGYEVPVPNGWVILVREPKSFTMADTSPTPPRDGGRFHTTAVVTVNVDAAARGKDPKDANTLASWVSFERRQLTGRNVEAVTEKTLTAGQESITCLGGKELKAAIKELNVGTKVPQIEAMSLTCRSDRGLRLMFVGESSDVNFFYALVPQIHPIS